MQTITPDMLLRGYAMGVFPMAESADATGLQWVEPRERGILPLDGFHISRSLRREIARGGYAILPDGDFRAVMEGCADRPETWINAEILELYTALHRMGHAHSLEMREAGVLVGGVYGVALGRVFFAESMFSRRRSASKIVLAWLMHRLRAGGFVLCDTQFPTPHLASLGGIALPRAAFQRLLARGLRGRALFDPPLYQPSCEAVASGSSTAGGGESSVG